MTPRRTQQGLHVIRRDEIALREVRPRLHGQQEHRRTPGAHPEGQRRRPAGLLRQVEDVGHHVAVDADLLHRVRPGPQVGRTGDGVDPERIEVVRVPAGVVHLEDGPLRVTTRVRDGELQEEPIELRLRQRVGPLELDRVLRRGDEERLRERTALPLGRDLMLLHGLQQGGLGLRRRPVDLVGEEEVA